MFRGIEILTDFVFVEEVYGCVRKVLAATPSEAS